MNLQEKTCLQETRKGKKSLKLKNLVAKTKSTSFCEMKTWEGKIQQAESTAGLAVDFRIF